MSRALQFELRLAERMSRLGTETAFEVLNRARELERQGRRMIHPALRFMAIAAAIAIVGVVILVIGASWSLGLCGGPTIAMK